ncbi:MAG: helix-turn-helix domain-containing protein [Rikenellaceae bacterium]
MGEIITHDSEQVTRFVDTLDSLQESLETMTLNCKPTLNGESYLTDKEVSERLKISERTLQDWRSKGIIDYIKFRGKVIYAESAIQRLLDKHFQKAWR